MFSHVQQIASATALGTKTYNGSVWDYSEVNTATAYLGGLLSIGGADLSVARKRVSVAAGATAGTVTGIGFQPDFIIGHTIFKQIGSNNQSALFTIGFATSAAARSVYGRAGGGIGGAGNNYIRSASTSILGTTAASSFTITSFDADGFTYTCSAPSGATFEYDFLLLKDTGASFKVGNFTTASTTGSQSVTGVGFKPYGCLFLTSSGVTMDTQVTNDIWMSLGMASLDFGTSSYSQVCNGTGHYNPSGGSNTGGYSHHDDRVISVYRGDVGSHYMAANLTSFDSDGFTLNFSTNNGTTRPVLYAAFGNSGEAWGTPKAFIPTTYGLLAATGTSTGGLYFSPGLATTADGASLSTGTYQGFSASADWEVETTTNLEDICWGARYNNGANISSVSAITGGSTPAASTISRLPLLGAG